MRTARFFALALVATLETHAMAESASYRNEIEGWRKARETRLRGDDGWLTVAGLYWLKEGDNRFGTDPKGDIVLPDKSAPARAGLFRLQKGHVTVEVAPGTTVTLAGNTIEKAELRADLPGPPDVLALGALRMFVIDRGGRKAIRLRDLQSPARRTLPPLRWFPIRAEYRVTGKFVAHAAPKTLSVPNVLGMVEPMVSPGYVEFRLGERTLRLEPVYEEPDAQELFFIFRDATSGHETYGGGRFFYADKPRNGEVVLDFNKAYTPPCAFTRFATCPLPPKQNHLPVRIEAGELNDGLH